MEIYCLLFLFFRVFSTTIGSKVNPTAEVNLEVMYLKQRTAEMEIRIASLENRETADIVERIKEDLLAVVQDTEAKSLEEKNQLLAKMEEMEMESRKRRNDISVKLEELQRWTATQRDEVLKRVEELETRWEQSTTKVEKKLQKAEYKFKKVDDHLLLQVLELKPILKQSVEKLRSVEEEVTSALERERLKTHSLQVQITELNSELHSVDLIRKNMSSLTDNLRLQLNESFTFGLENIQLNLTRNMRIFENSYLKFSKDVSKLDENLKILEKTAKNEREALQSELSPRLENLEERSALCDDVPDMKKTLSNHSSQLSRLNQQLWDVENTCAGEPPSIRNGKPLKFQRKHKSHIQYECDLDFFLTGNSTIVCDNGYWEGQPPNCSFFDTTSVLVASQENITCYSDRHVQKIAFSRVLNTGSGAGLPNHSSTRRDKGAVLEFNAAGLIYRNGVYECGFQMNDKSVGIVVPIDYFTGVWFEYASKVANIGDTVEFEVTTLPYIDQSKLRWRRNGGLVSNWDGEKQVKISGVQPDDAGIYECYGEGRRTEQQSFFRLIVRKCGKNRYGGSCEQECPVCYNGGICDDHLGLCVCPAGFTGKNCEFACGENHVSADCAKLCAGSDCKLHLFCKPNPFGCSCFPGFKGRKCDKLCEPGQYGADCNQICHCAAGAESCNRITGACSGGCSPGWSGQSCQIPT